MATTKCTIISRNSQLATVQYVCVTKSITYQAYVHTSLVQALPPTLELPSKMVTSIGISDCDNNVRAADTPANPAPTTTTFLCRRRSACAIWVQTLPAARSNLGGRARCLQLIPAAVKQRDLRYRQCMQPYNRSFC